MRLNASFVVCPENHHEIYEAALLARDMGFDSIAFRPEIAFTQRTEEALRYEQSVSKQIERARVDLHADSFGVYGGEDRLADGKEAMDDDLVCYYSNHQSYVAANGDVYPCCYTRYNAKFSLGNILEKPFGEFWFDERRMKLYQKIVYNSCPPCPYGMTNEVLKGLHTKSIEVEDVLTRTSDPDFFV